MAPTWSALNEIHTESAELVCFFSDFCWLTFTHCYKGKTFYYTRKNIEHITNSWIWQTTRKVIDSLTISELQGRRKEEPLRSLRKCGYVDRLRGILGAPFSLSRPQVEHELIKPWDRYFQSPCRTKQMVCTWLRPIKLSRLQSLSWTHGVFLPDH